jgi:hypothetical protein
MTISMTMTMFIMTITLWQCSLWQCMSVHALVTHKCDEGIHWHFGCSLWQCMSVHALVTHKSDEGLGFRLETCLSVIHVNRIFLRVFRSNFVWCKNARASRLLQSLEKLCACPQRSGTATLTHIFSSWQLLSMLLSHIAPPDLQVRWLKLPFFVFLVFMQEFLAERGTMQWSFT